MLSVPFLIVMLSVFKLNAVIAEYHGANRRVFVSCKCFQISFTKKALVRGVLKAPN